MAMRTKEFIPEKICWGTSMRRLVPIVIRRPRRPVSPRAKAMGMPVRTMVKKARAMSANMDGYLLSSEVIFISATSSMIPPLKGTERSGIHMGMGIISAVAPESKASSVP